MLYEVITVAVPKMAGLVGMGGDVAPKVSVRDEEDLLGVEGVDHANGVGARAAARKSPGQ